MRATGILVLAAFLFATVDCQQDGAIRLYSYGYDNTLTAGIVEVYYSSTWNTICRLNSFGSQSWGWNEANVACQQLGYTGASGYSYSGASDYGNDDQPMKFSDLDCSSSSYLVLLQCLYEYDSVISTCSSIDDLVTVSCYSSLLTDSPYTGMVRLQGGLAVTSGLVEVYCNSQWGTLCNTTFTSSVALTVCLQLGYNDWVSYTSGTNPGGSQPIWLSDYTCFTEYSCLYFCQTCPATSPTGCDHSQDIYLTCEHDSSSFNYGSTRYSCSYYLSPGAIAGIIFGSIVIFAICLCLWIGIPVCICCCLGVGIGAAAGHHRHHYDHV